MIENPELAKWVEKHGNDLARGGCDFIILVVEFDIGTGVNLRRVACGSRRDVQPR